MSKKIIFTNGLAVFAPALVGEGVNVLSEAYSNYMEPVAQATNETEISDIFIEIRVTRTFEWYFIYVQTYF